MQKAIIATDLVNFFGNKSELSEIVDAKSFSWEIPRHKYKHIIYKINDDVCIYAPKALFKLLLIVPLSMYYTRELVKCLMMTICDLCGTCKPWEIHSKCVVDIYDEFYDQVTEYQQQILTYKLYDHSQGDLEKSKGLNSIEMMDRNLRHKLPEFQVGIHLFCCLSLGILIYCQVGFIGGIAEPCSKLLANVMPHVDTLLQTTR